ncbi:MAG TPA: hypothetical protein VJ949_09600, partial [Cryomorphaceae bacterium]|nr:hypothetical protein [Cryomorphaceae bacterium]
MKKLFALCALALLPFFAQAQTLTVNVISLTQSSPIDSMEVFLVGPRDIISDFTDAKGKVVFQNL